MGMRPCCSKEGLNKGTWTVMEDKILSDYIKLHGEGGWSKLPHRAGLKRCGKSCRLRWLNYLKPDIKRGNISLEEEDLIIRLHRLLGNRWSLIARRLPGRTDNEIKNYWNTNLKRKRKVSDQFKPLAIKQCAGAPPSKMDSQPGVIQTKALRCTRVIVIKNVEFPTLVGDQTITHEVGDARSTGGGPLTHQEDNSSSTLMDFGVEDLCISEFFELDDIALRDSCSASSAVHLWLDEMEQKSLV